MSRILSISASVHDSGIALIDSGNVICAFEEERFKRLKGIFNQFSFPELSLKELHKQFGITPFDEDVIVVMSKPIVCGLDYLEKILQFKEIYLYEHHDCHAATAYLLSGFNEETLVLTYDAGDSNGIEERVLTLDVLQKIRDQKLPVRKTQIPEEEYIKVMASIKKNDGTAPCQLWMPEGSYIMDKKLIEDSCSISYHIGKNNSFHNSTYIKGTHTLASFWDFYCGLNGLFGGRDEGKILGLSSQGKFNQMIFDAVGKFFKFEENLKWDHVHEVNDFFSKLDLKNDMQLRKDSAFMVQKFSEQYMLELVDWLKKQNPNATKLALAGGFFSNVKVNQVINEYSSFDEIFIAPGMGDGGLALGAALLHANKLGEFQTQKINHVFWGSHMDLSFSTVGYYEAPFNEDFISDCLISGKVIGIFNGRREWGPRALGSTSIIFDATNPESHNFINERLDRNDEMPFAPIVLEGQESKVFHCYKSKYAAKFMTLCYTVKDQWRERIPGVVNKYDNTSRIQIVDYLNNPFHDILSSYYLKTGIPVLMNTSFNVHGEPIINTPEQAFGHLKSGVIDYLVVGSKIFRNPNESELNTQNLNLDNIFQV